MTNEMEPIVIKQECNIENAGETLTFEQIGGVCRCCLSSADSLIPICESVYKECVIKKLLEKYCCLKVNKVN